MLLKQNWLKKNNGGGIGSGDGSGDGGGGGGEELKEDVFGLMCESGCVFGEVFRHGRTKNEIPLQLMRFLTSVRVLDRGGVKNVTLGIMGA
ncbi:hypothetical protein Tco_1475407 [Tanacetum coccineum]